MSAFKKKRKRKRKKNKKVRPSRRNQGCGVRPLTFSRYLSRISCPQLAHVFFPVDGAELVVEVGEHTDGVDGVLGAERVSSRSMLDRWDSPSE